MNSQIDIATAAAYATQSRNTLRASLSGLMYRAARLPVLRGQGMTLSFMQVHGQCKFLEAGRDDRTGPEPCI